MKSDYIKLHIIILILAFTGLLGDIITIHALDLVWYRTLIGSLGLMVWGMILSKKKKGSYLQFFQLNGKNIMLYLMIGMFIGLHWFCFFHSIHLSNISVGVGCLSSAALFTTVLESIFFRRKIQLLDVFTSLLIIAGLYIIFQFETKYVWGIVYALGAAFFASLFTVLNKKYVSNNGDSSFSVTFYEIVGAWIVCNILLIGEGDFSVWEFSLSQNDWISLLILGLVCTSYTFVVNIEILQRLSAFVVVLAFNLEPIYGMVLGAFQGEKMTIGFYIGACVILSAVFLYPIAKRKFVDKSVA